MPIPQPGHVRLSEELASFVADAVRSGRYASAEAVVADALSLLKDHERWKMDARRKIEEGWLAAERGDFVDGGTFMADLMGRIDRGEFDRARAG